MFVGLAPVSVAGPTNCHDLFFMRSPLLFCLPVALIAVGACGQPSSVPSPVPAPSATPAGQPSETGRASTIPETKPRAQRPGETRAFAEELASQDKRIASAIKRFEAQPSSFIAADSVANHYLARARLSGDYGDYATAEEWVSKAFGVDPEGDFGPFLTRASLNYTLHRLNRVDADFELGQRGRKDNVTVSGHRLFAANLALQRGQYDDCARLLDESLALHESVSNLAAKAYFELGIGHVEVSESFYRRAIDKYHGPTREPIAWLHLQLGLSDLGRGRYEDALAHYRDAEKKLEGYWLIDEHIAEVLYLLGKTEDAKKLYLDIIERTQNPEFMDAMAGIAYEEGRTTEGDEYVARAEKRYQELMAIYPEAAYGHALEHYLEFGKDPGYTVELAEKNHALRPNADARVLLAQAYLKAARLDDAKRIIGEALATPWTTADLHTTAAAVFRTSGDSKAADEQLAKAKAIDPHASE